MSARRMVKSLHNMDFDEVSFVDRPANQHASMLISKRAPEEELMPDFYNDNGGLLTEDQLVEGATVFDEDGEAYTLVAEDGYEDEYEFADASEEVGKSYDFSSILMEELSKADSDEQRDYVLSKALGRVQELEEAQGEAFEIAKSERDLRLTREYISKAAEYNVPIAPEELGPVLYRMAETMPYEDCAVIAKALEAAGEIIYDEIGYQGGGDNVDIYAMADAAASEYIGKSDDGISKAHAVEGVFDMNPDAYEAYLAERIR